MAKPVFIARTKLPAKREGEKERWVSIGAAFDARFSNGDGLSVQLHSMPFGWNGQFVLMPPLEGDNQGA